MDPTLRMLFTEAAVGSLTSEERALIITGYHQAIATIRKNITSLGFSACSLADNNVSGTEVNYRSVWARDGSITIVGTIELNDPDIREAQKQTLRTLFSHLARNGQMPANAHRRRTPGPAAWADLFHRQRPQAIIAFQERFPEMISKR
jgi:hypothetical protein